MKKQIQIILKATKHKYSFSSGASGRKADDEFFVNFVFMRHHRGEQEETIQAKLLLLNKEGREDNKRREL